MPEPMDPFYVMVAQLEYGALVALGQLENPVTKQTKREESHARVFIDQLDMLSKKTEGNLTPQEKQVLDLALYRTRMLFVQKDEAAKLEAEAEKPEQPEA